MLEATADEENAFHFAALDRPHPFDGKRIILIVITQFAFSATLIVRLAESCASVGDCLGMAVETLCESVPALLPKFPRRLLKTLLSRASLGSANEINWLRFGAPGDDAA